MKINLTFQILIVNFYRNENEQKININNNLLLCSLISHADYKLRSDLKPHRIVFRYKTDKKSKYFHQI